MRGWEDVATVLILTLIHIHVGTRVSLQPIANSTLPPMAGAHIAYLGFLLVPFLIVRRVGCQSFSTVSITAYPGFSAQRQCAQCALIYLNNLECYGTPGAQNYLNCGGVPLNECYCRPDFSSEVSVFLSTNIASNCQPGPNSDDISTAESMYHQYCLTVLAPPAASTSTSTTAAPPPTLSPSPTPAPGSTVTSGVAKSTSLVVVTASSGSGSSTQATSPITSKWLSLLAYIFQIALGFLQVGGPFPSLPAPEIQFDSHSACRTR